MKLELAAALTLGFALCACSGDDSKTAPRPDKHPAIVLVVDDAGVVVAPGIDPSGMHLDDIGGAPRPAPQPPLEARERRAIDVTLRSTPPGARVAVDGTAVGVTPAFWSGWADGREHEYVFTLPGHAIARYRFVPVSSGVIHARLEPIIVERDAGVAPPPEVVPRPSPSAVVPPAPPPTIVTPAPDAPIVTPPAPQGLQGSAAPPNPPVGPLP